MWPAIAAMHCGPAMWPPLDKARRQPTKLHLISKVDPSHLEALQRNWMQLGGGTLKKGVLILAAG